MAAFNSGKEGTHIKVCVNGRPWAEVTGAPGAWAANVVAAGVVDAPSGGGTPFLIACSRGAEATITALAGGASHPPHTITAIAGRGVACRHEEAHTDTLQVCGCTNAL